LEYEMMLWCDFTTQMNELVDQILPYGRFAWGNEENRFETAIGSVTFETVNSVGEDRLVRATIPLTVKGTLLSAQETRLETIKKMYSVKKVTFINSVDVGYNIFNTTTIPQQLLAASQTIAGGGSVIVNSGGTSTNINAVAMAYITGLTEQQAVYSNSTTVTVNALAAINPTLLNVATKNEFDVYINGQYIDKSAYAWTPSDVTTQTIVFDTGVLGYDLLSGDTITVNGRWA